MRASGSASSRRTLIPYASILLLLSGYFHPHHRQLQLFANAQSQLQDPFDCHVSFDDGTYFDLTSLGGEHVIRREYETPPSTTIGEVRFDLCGDLPRKDGVSQEDQCEQGTRACLTKTNRKGNQGDRVIEVIPLAVSSALNPETTILLSPNKGLSLIFHGSEYPKTNPRPQLFSVTLYCDTKLSEPEFKQYEGGEMRVEWRAPAGCAAQRQGDEGEGGDKDGDNKEGDEKKEKEVGSGVGWFFLLLLLAFIAYFVIGAYYNYSTYGATGADLIPHRDFWREVPYVLRDIASHLCSALRPSPRNGYIAV